MIMIMCLHFLMEICLKIHWNYISFRSVYGWDWQLAFYCTPGTVKKSDCCIKWPFFKLDICVGFPEILSVKGER